MTISILQGDVVERLREIPDGTVHCVVTSPPYYGLRDYQVEGQIGLEKTPEEYINKMVGVFKEVKRVLRDDGTVWLNMGDCYWGSGNASGHNEDTMNLGAKTAEYGATKGHTVQKHDSLKPKDLIGMPWRLAFALQQPQYNGKIRSEKNRIWLAAMVEAEGCMFIHKRKAGDNGYSKYTKKDGTISEYNRTQDNYGAGLEVASTDKVIVERCMQIAGIGSICEQTPTQNNRRKQTIYRWNVRSNECKWIIEELYPHFIAKQLEARLVLGCPPSGEDAKKAHESLKAIHQGGPAIIDFPAPKSLYVPGWYLRSDVIWSKCNPMPESVTDRPTKSHEYVFLLTKKARYFYDADAIREPHVTQENRPDGIIRNRLFAYDSKENQLRPKNLERSDPNTMHKAREMARDGTNIPGHSGNYNANGECILNPAGRNRRTVWEIATQPFPEAHFATFPEALVEPCIKAGTSERGCCPACGAPWERVIKEGNLVSSNIRTDVQQTSGNGETSCKRPGHAVALFKRERETTGWQPTCQPPCSGWRASCQPPGGGCADGLEPLDPVPCVVLDPFMGSGTTLKVARDLKRDAIGIEINPEYVKIARERLRLNEQLLDVVS